MKRKYLTGIVCLAASLTVLLAACGTANSDGSASVPSTDGSDGSASVQSPDGSNGSTSGSSSSAPGEETVFMPGTWLSDGGQYYFFDEDGAAGRTASLEDGTGVGFSYTVSGTQAAFSMGGADNTTSCTVSRDGDTLILEWADGTTEHLTYVSGQGSDTFQFYTNQELADLALSFYQDNNNGQDSQNLLSAAQTNEDGSVSIQVYENLGDHNSTAAWYTVDRTTAAGTDGSGNEVDLDG